MTHPELLTKIEELAGPLRAKTFRAAVEFALKHYSPDKLIPNLTPVVETGCYRGIPQDGQSTMIWALLAMHLGVRAVSIDIDGNHIELAKRLCGPLAAFVEFIHGDSVTALSLLPHHPVLVYLDSYDHDPANPGPCQRHQLAEMGAIYGKMVAPCAVLLDDNDFKSGGKTLLTKTFLQERGWKTVMEGYQILLVKE